MIRTSQPPNNNWCLSENYESNDTKAHVLNPNLYVCISLPIAIRFSLSATSVHSPVRPAKLKHTECNRMESVDVETTRTKVDNKRQIADEHWGQPEQTTQNDRRTRKKGGRRNKKMACTWSWSECIRNSWSRKRKQYDSGSPEVRLPNKLVQWQSGNKFTKTCCRTSLARKLVGCWHLCTAHNDHYSGPFNREHTHTHTRHFLRFHSRAMRYAVPQTASTTHSHNRLHSIFNGLQ